MTSALHDIQSLLTLPAGRTLFYKQDRVEHVYSLVDGTVRVGKLLADGRRQITGFLLPNDFLGFSLGPTHVCDAETSSDTVVCRFPAKAFTALCARFPQLEHHVLRLVCNELAAAQDHMLMLGRRSPIERLASFLVDLSQRNGAAGRSTNPLHLDMPRRDIADYLGVTTETVSRSFTRLRGQGIVALPDPHIVQILDHCRLDALTR